MRVFCGIIGVAVCLLLPGASPAAEQKSTSIWPKLKVGKVGSFMQTKTKYWKVRIVELVSVDIMLVQIDRDLPRFLVRGLPTKDLADDTILELKGEWKVTGTGPYDSDRFGYKTYFIVEPLKKATKGKPKDTDKEAAKEDFKSDFALTAKAPKTWSLRKAKTDGKILADKDFTFTKLPKAIEGGTLLVRDPASHRYWLSQEVLTASKDGTAYALFMWKWQDMEQVSEATLAKLANEGWTEVKEEVATTSPESEVWKWKVLKKSVKKGTVNLKLRETNWQTTLTLFAFK